MPYTVYLLYSKKDRKLYVGCTSNLEARIERHKKGYILATKYRRPLVLIHSEIFEDKATAFNRERFFKSLWGAREKKRLLKKYLETDPDRFV
jgi:putative endonuclease